MWLGMLVVVSVLLCEPPVAPGSSPEAAPRINLSRRSGVPPLPLHNAQPDGMFARVPDHITITPVGIILSTYCLLAMSVEVLGLAILALPFPSLDIIVLAVASEVGVIPTRLVAMALASSHSWVLLFQRFHIVNLNHLLVLE